MPIKFEMNLAEGYYIAEYIGSITDAEMLDSWRKFFRGKEWYPGLKNLSDLSQANTDNISAEGVNKLAGLIKSIYQERNGGDEKAAIFVADKLLFGMARMFTAWMGETPIKLHIFEDKNEAMDWLLNEQNDLLEQAGP